MNILSFFGTAIIAFLGIGAGIFLTRFAPEEQKPGKRYFEVFRKVLICFMVLFVLIFYQMNVILSILVFVVFVYLVSSERLNLEKNLLIYILLGIVLAISYQFQSLFIIEAILIFAYGMVDASIRFNIKKKNYSEVLGRNLLFFIPLLSVFTIALF